MKQITFKTASIVDVIEKFAGIMQTGFEKLGLNNTSTGMGAIESHGKTILDSSEHLASAIAFGCSDIADALRFLAETIAKKEKQ